jgi:molecular chaperone GrpE
MTDHPDTRNRYYRLLNAFTPETCRTVGIYLFMVSCVIFWASIMNILIRQLNPDDLPEIYPSLVLLGIGVLGIFAGINIMMNPEWRFILWFVAPCSLFSLMAVLFLAAGYPEVWKYPFISYLGSEYGAGLAILILNFFILIAGRKDSLLDKETQDFVVPHGGQGKPVRYLSGEDRASPVRSLESGALVLIAKIEDLESELETTKKKSLSEHRKVLRDILDVVDSLESIIAVLQQRVSDGETNLKKIVNNFRSVKIRTEQVLTAAGVRPIETPDERANPGTHTILETRNRPDLEDYTILEEIQKGYVWNGQILREAKVIVGMKQG